MIKQLLCKATNIIAEIQKVGNPERPSKLQNSSAKVSRNSRKLLRKKKKQIEYNEIKNPKLRNQGRKKKG